MNLEHFNKLQQQLEAAGHLGEILDSDGTIKPTESAIQKVETQYRDSSDADQHRFAQAQTLMDLAEKYQAELN